MRARQLTHIAPRRQILAALTGLALLGMAATPAARADTVASSTGGVNSSGLALYFGQSFTVTTPTPENNITFNFFSDVPPTTPYAIGTAFLLSAPYLSTPAALSSATPGFLGQATASGNLYAFAPSLTLQPATQYFLYENALIPIGGISGNSAYLGGSPYIAASASTNFAPTAGSTNFLVTGSAASSVSVVPESSGLANMGGALLALALAGVVMAVKKKQAKAAV